MIRSRLCMGLLLVAVSMLNYAAVLPIDEAMLLVCQQVGSSLYNSCVATLPVNPDQTAACGTLKASYLACLQALNAPYPLVPSLDPDPYVDNLFTPCTYETGHLVLPSICPTLP